MAFASNPLKLPVDGRQSATALSVARGTTRLLHQLGFSAVSELALPSGRRADLAALNGAGDIWIVEIKSSIADFRSDSKWQEYRDYCDAFLFAVAPDFPSEILPAETGLILADAYAGELVRAPPTTHPLAAARHVRQALKPDGTWLVVEPYAADEVAGNLNPVGRIYYNASTQLCVPNALSQPGGYALGAQAGEAAIRQLTAEAGFTRFRRAAETPFNLVYEVRP